MCNTLAPCPICHSAPTKLHDTEYGHAYECFGEDCHFSSWAEFHLSDSLLEYSTIENQATKKWNDGVSQFNFTQNT